MGLSEQDLDFLNDHHSAAMITVAGDGVAKIARVGVALDTAFAWLALETTVTILDGPDAPVQSLHLFRQMQGKPSGPLSWFGGELTEEEFLRAMVEEQRLIYDFEVHRTYGLH